MDISFLGRQIDLIVEEVTCLRQEMVDRGNGFIGQKSGDKGDMSQFLAGLHAASCASKGDSSIFYQIQSRTAIELMPSIRSNENSHQEDAVDDIRKVTAGLEMERQKIMLRLSSSLLTPHVVAPGGGPTRPPRGILVYGPSGVGKSRLAAQVGRDIANAAIRQKGREIFVETIPTHSIQSFSSIVGCAERELRRIFDRAELRASKGMSSLLILDDVHIICPRRGFMGSGGNCSEDMVASTLLALLDGIGYPGGGADPKLSEDDSTAPAKAEVRHQPGTIMVLAITSDPMRLDPAIRRPGRLDLEIEIPIPDEKTRCHILRFLLDGLDQGCATVTAPNVSEDDVLRLARLGKGLTGADCSLALKEAVRCAASRRHQSTGFLSTSSDVAVNVTHEDLMQAIRLSKPSTIRTVTVEVPKVSWSSIGGMKEVKRQLREAVELPVTHSHLFEGLKVPPPRGVLLFGPPGNSKTLMARAMATEGNMNFLAVKGPELLSKWLGESERALASLFRRARMASPAVIFFDELDAIAAKRGARGGSEERLLSQLLTELDGVKIHSLGGIDEESSCQEIVVVGATNRPDLIDPALTRPGRIDRKIYVGLPDEESRRAIIMIGLKGKLIDNDVDVSSVAGLSSYLR